MARLVGVDLPREKRVEVALTYIFGVGRTTASKALAETGVDVISVGALTHSSPALDLGLDVNVR